MAKERETQNGKKNGVKAKANQAEQKSGYGNKKLEGPDRPST